MFELESWKVGELERGSTPHPARSFETFKPFQLSNFPTSPGYQMNLGSHLEVLFTSEQIQQRVRELGAQIQRDHLGKELILVGVLKGAFVFVADLARNIDLPLAVDFIGLSSYGEATESSGIVKITSDLSRPIEGKHVVIVEDIIDTG